uniref:GT23 domain-containing protein n=1 Tax=Ciona savignyi TaxID=51511 RepID=H2YS60_CIOSA
MSAKRICLKSLVRFGLLGILALIVVFVYFTGISARLWNCHLQARERVIPFLKGAKLDQENQQENTTISNFNDDDLLIRLMQNSKMLEELFFYHLKNPKIELEERDLFKQLGLQLQQTIRVARMLYSDIEKLYSNAFREKQQELEKLNALAFSFISNSQNPSNCSSAKKLFCNVKHHCGLGCMMHHYSLCLFIALGTNRVMIWDLNQVTEYPGLQDAIKSPSHCQSSKEELASAPEWRSPQETEPTPSDAPIVKVTGYKNSVFAPNTVPSQFLPRIELVLADPLTWWTGQVMNYLFRLKESMSKEVEDFKTKTGFGHPIVGIHVRRTDKIKEANYQDLNSYMEYAINWYDQYVIRHGNVRRKIYLASDDPAIMEEAKSKYTNYQFIFGESACSDVYSRFTKNGLFGIVKDIFLLRGCDYVVLTMSSNIGRMIQEMRQTSLQDATFHFANLDYSYHANGGRDIVHEVLLYHNPLVHCDRKARRHTDGSCELTMKVGDRITNYPMMKRGTMLGGFNQRTNQVGMYPAFKVKTILVPESYPISMVENDVF